MTVREWLASHQNGQHIDTSGVYPDSLDAELREPPSLVIGDDARLFVRCGGYALVSFRVGKNPRAMYLVVDDGDGERWDVLRSRGVPMTVEAMREHGLTYYRPSPQLRLVQSA